MGEKQIEETAEPPVEVAPEGVPEREVVAVRTSGAHDHIERVKFADGTDSEVAPVIAAILAHEAHYVMHLETHVLPLLLHVRQCPDCLEDVLWA